MLACVSVICHVYDLWVENFSKNKWITLFTTPSDVSSVDIAASLWSLTRHNWNDRRWIASLWVAPSAFVALFSTGWAGVARLPPPCILPASTSSLFGKGQIFDLFLNSIVNAIVTWFIGRKRPVSPPNLKIWKGSPWIYFIYCRNPLDLRWDTQIIPQQTHIANTNFFTATDLESHCDHLNCGDKVWW